MTPSSVPAKSLVRKSTRSRTMAIEAISAQILIVRRQKVLVDTTLAALYGVATKVLLQAVKRHAIRFPSDFMFRLTRSEFESLRSQSVTSNIGRGGRRHAPYVFTEQGVAMLSSVLNSRRAVAVNIEIMRAFVRMREALTRSDRLGRKLDALERHVARRLDGQ
ncbi:MAG TPA: ORF6N domain-containing protein, partial [Rhodanobacteraceae bacterium]|nr:ORF6N domain-containing protein [Rhodanobacteraceae bacterium]